MYDSTITGINALVMHNKPILVESEGLWQDIPTNIIFASDVHYSPAPHYYSKTARATDSKLEETKLIMDTITPQYKIQAVLGIGGMSSKLIIKK